MSVTLESSDNVSRSTCAEKHDVKCNQITKNVSIIIVDIERTILETLDNEGYSGKKTNI